METAAAILTKLTFEQNDPLKSQLQAFTVNTSQGAEAIILPVYREILAALEGGASVRGGWNASRGLRKLANIATLSEAIIVPE
jgi:hypothetical protein